MAEFPKRRRHVSLARCRDALLRRGFVQSVWPAPANHQWVLTYVRGGNKITVVLGPHRGHPAVIPAIWDGRRWRARHAEPPRDNVAAARQALALYHRIRSTQERAA
jgi:hypothetical protein